MSLLSLHLILYAAYATAIPLIAVGALALLGRRLPRRVCGLILLATCIRILIPTGWVHGIVNLGDGEAREVIILESGESLTLREEDISGEVIAMPESGGMIKPEADAPVGRSDPAVTVLLLWAAVALLLLVARTLPFTLSVRRVLRRRVECDGRLIGIYREVGAEMGLRRLPELVTVEGYVTPHLCGIFKKRIMIGEVYASDVGIRDILRHELTHFRRRDVEVKLIATLAVSVFWWNPAVYLLAARLDEVLELACDEAVLTGASSEERIEYAETVYRVMREGVIPERSSAALISADGRRAQARFSAMLEGRKVRGGGAAICITAVAMLLSAVAVGCAAPSDVGEGNLGLFVTGETGREAIDGLSELPEAPSCDGYRQIGWSIGTGEPVAVYTPVSYEIRLIYNSEEGEARVSLPFGAELPTPTASGRSFDGWYADAALTRRVTAVPSEAVRLYAGWRGESAPADFIYSEVSGGLAVVGYRGAAETVRIPEWVSGRAVVEIADGALAGCGCSELIIPKNVTRVGAFALSECKNLRRVTMYDGVDIIGRGALSGCDALLELAVVGVGVYPAPSLPERLFDAGEEGER